MWFAETKKKKKATGDSFREKDCVWPSRISKMSSDQNPGWLGYIGDYTTQLYIYI